MYIYINFFSVETSRNVPSRIVAPSFAGMNPQTSKCCEKNSFIKFSSPGFITSVEESSRTAGQVRAGEASCTQGGGWGRGGGSRRDLTEPFKAAGPFFCIRTGLEGEDTGMRTSKCESGNRVTVGGVGVRGPSAPSRDPPAQAASHSFQNTQLPTGIVLAAAPLEGGRPPGSVGGPCRGQRSWGSAGSQEVVRPSLIN